jgi:type VI secretion system protein ImpG
MLEPLLPHFERELEAFQGAAAAFAERYPEVARHLIRDRSAWEDPHVERLVQGFALLAARIHRKLDDGYPGITEAFTQVLFPHCTRPLPSATILQLAIDPARAGSLEGITIPRGAAVLAPEVQGIRCGFRTAREVDLLPVEVTRAVLEPATAGAEATLTLELATRVSGLKLDRLTFFLDGEPPLMHVLYELLLFRVQEVRISGARGEPARVLPATTLQPVGFEAGEALFDFDDRSFPGFRLLAEYFAFPDHFMFFRLNGLGTAPQTGQGGPWRIEFPLGRFGGDERHRRLAQTLAPANFRLGCVPAVNLFRHPGTPIPVTHRQPSYPVTPDGRRPETCAVYSIDSVQRRVLGQDGEAVQRVAPFYRILHHDLEQAQDLYWYASREPGPPDQDPPLELTLVDLAFRTLRPERETLSLQLTCTDRDLPASIPFGGGSAVQDDFELPGHALVTRARALRKPTPGVPAPAPQGLQRRLLSHLALNRLSLAERGKEALQELLELYHGPSSQAAALQIQGIHEIKGGPCSIRVPGREFTSPIRGEEVDITFDENGYAGSNLYLFATVLERFFSHLCGPNSFVQFRMRTRQKEGEVARWPPRFGAETLT